MTKRVLFLLLLASLAGCEKHPVNKLINPALSNAAGIWDTSADWVIYDDEIRTGGTVRIITSPENQVLDFNCRDNSHSGSKCIKYSWNGRSVYSYDPINPGLETTFCGFRLTAREDAISSRDISGGAYTKISFWVRGSLNSFVYLRLEADNGGPTTATPIGPDAWMSSSLTPITSDWQRFEFNITGPMVSVKDFVKIILKYDEGVTPNTAVGNGGTVFIDDIKLTH